MIKKSSGIIFICVLLSLFCAFSYYKSKSSAVTLVGDTLRYFPLSRSSIAIEPSEGKSIVWEFMFSFPNSYDEDLYVYTNMFGSIKSTKPKRLEYLLRCYEKQELHPYSKESIEIAIKRSHDGITAR
jgi:hypothetical protein